MATEPFVISAETPMRDYIKARGEDTPIIDGAVQPPAAEEKIETAPAAAEEVEVEAPPESEESTEEQAAAEVEVEKKKKSGGGFQRKINKLTAANYELQQKLNAKEASQAKPVETAPPDFPNLDQLETLAERDAAIGKYYESKIDQKLAEAEAKRTQESKTREIQDAYAKRLDEAKSKYSDWNEVMESVGEMEISNIVSDAIKRSKNGPDIIYHIGTNQDVVAQLNAMDPIEAVAEIGFISASLMPAKSAPVEKKPISAAPPPIRPISGAGTKSHKSLYDDNLSMKDHMRMREEEKKAARR